MESFVFPLIPHNTAESRYLPLSQITCITKNPSYLMVSLSRPSSISGEEMSTVISDPESPQQRSNILISPRSWKSQVISPKPDSRNRFKNRLWPSVERSFEPRVRGSALEYRPSPSFESEFQKENTITVSVPLIEYSDNRSVFRTEDAAAIGNSYVQDVLHDSITICHSAEYRDDPQAAREPMSTLVKDANVRITSVWEERVRDGSLSAGSKRIVLQLVPSLDHAPGQLYRNPHSLFVLSNWQQEDLRQSVVNLVEFAKSRKQPLGIERAKDH